MSDSTPHYYTISEVGRKLKLAESTLKYYEKEFTHYLKIKRSIGNRRLYTDFNINQFRVVLKLLKRDKMSIAEVREHLLQEIEQASAPEPPGKTTSVHPKPSMPPVLGQAAASEPAPALELPANVATRDDIEQLVEKLDQVLLMQKQLMNGFKRVAITSREMRQLLDLNIQRYNLLSQKMLPRD